MAGQSAKMVPVLQGEISNRPPVYTKPPVERASAYFYTTIGAASSKFDDFLAKRSQFDIDHDQIWQAYADRSGNGSYLKKWPNEWPGRVGSLWPSFEARLQAASWHLTYSIYTAKL